MRFGAKYVAFRRICSWCVWLRCWLAKRGSELANSYRPAVVQTQYSSLSHPYSVECRHLRRDSSTRVLL